MTSNGPTRRYDTDVVISNLTSSADRAAVITVMIVDDHEIVRRGIAEVVERAEGMHVVAEAGSVADGVRRAGLVHPQIMLVDLQLPDGTGIDLMKKIRETQPEVRAIVLTSFDDDDALAAALDAGAVAYLLKSVRGAEITDVVRAVAAGRTLLDERTVTRHKAGHDDPTEHLTPSELRVLDLIGEGLSNREIAERLSVAEKTVKNHITSLLAKMGLQRRTQVAAWVAARKHSGWRAEPGDS
jgi:DNA-binding NarL/FixJ family response regulator